MKLKAESLPLNYCPIDRRSARSMSMDMATIIAVCTVLGTILLSTVLIMSLADPVPEFEIKYVHPELRKSPTFDKGSYKDGTHIPGAPMYALVEFCSSRAITYGNLVSTLETGGHLVSLEGRAVNLDAGCYSVSIPMSVPEGMPSGEYTLNTKVTGRINAIKTYSVPFFSVPVTIK